MNRYLCLKCGEVYNESFQPPPKSKNYIFCPKSSCIGKVVEVDELMIPTIKELNSKGYKTAFCCSGHLFEPASDCYIKFESIEDVPSTLPSGWIKGEDSVIRVKLYLLSLDPVELMQRISQENVNAYKWARWLKKKGE